MMSLNNLYTVLSVYYPLPNPTLESEQFLFWVRYYNERGYDSSPLLKPGVFSTPLPHVYKNYTYFLITYGEVIAESKAP